VAFPKTSPSLIHRIVQDNDESDWRRLLVDYWSPICRFAIRRAQLSHHDAEDIAAQTFVALLSNDLLKRWNANRSAKLRTLLCTVTLQIIANRARVNQGRERLLKRHGHDLGQNEAFASIHLEDATQPDRDAFEVAWVEETIQRVVETLMEKYHQEGKGDYFRVLYGRLCERMTSRQIADVLQLKVTDVENYYKAARKRLASLLEEHVHQEVTCYCDPEESDDAFKQEWAQLGEHLKSHGGLEKAVWDAYQIFDPTEQLARQQSSINKTLDQLIQLRNQQSK